MANTGTGVKRAKQRPEVLRYAHPFFTDVPAAERAETEFGRQMSEWARQALGPIPKVKRGGVMALSEIVGTQGTAEIAASGAIRFQASGDSGTLHGHETEDVAKLMAQRFHVQTPGTNPAFFLHLGDVIYGPQKDDNYRDEFYRPYMAYPGKIIALAGNHDGEVFQKSDPKSLRAYLANFCTDAPVIPEVAADARILRQTMTQPGVYFHVDAPFLDLICLYTNIAEGPGFLEGADADQAQVRWFNATLKKVAAARPAQRKALVIATHHPPYSTGGGHSGSPAVVDAIDAACQAAGVVPDAVLSGHSHSYQRHTRSMGHNGTSRSVPFITCGVAGRGLQRVVAGAGQKIGDVTFDKSVSEFGYIDVIASKTALTMEFRSLNQTGAVDTVTVPLH